METVVIAEMAVIESLIDCWHGGEHRIDPRFGNEQKEALFDND